MARPSAKRAARPPRSLDDQTVQRICELYTAAGWSIRRIAAELTLPRPTVASALRTGGIQVTPKGTGRTRPRTQPQLEPSLQRAIVDLYVVRGRSTRAIAEQLAIPRTTVTAALRVGGVTVAVKGAGRTRPRRQAPLKPSLQQAVVDLYVHQRLTRAEVARRLDISESRVRDCLRDLIVPMRTRGKGTREDRHRVPLAALESLYVDAELPADAVAAHLGATRGRVLATAHEQGVPVRPGGAVDNSRAVDLLAALYSDEEVTGALRWHGVPLVWQPGSITERFPIPTALTVELLKDLYLGCGLSTTQIELVTGQPTATVRRHLKSADLLIRPAGGLAPFTRRARLASLGRPTRERSRASQNPRIDSDVDRDPPPS